jgi:hypothetical protein
MTLRTDSKFPLHRSYVLKLSRETTANALRGRLENLVAGTHRYFESADDLIALIAGDIEAAGADSPISDPSSTLS